MKIKNKLKRFFAIKSNWANIITFIIAVVALTISFFFDDYSYQIIGAMFVLIVIENFILKITYMDDITQKTHFVKVIIQRNHTISHQENYNFVIMQ